MSVLHGNCLGVKTEFLGKLQNRLGIVIRHEKVAFDLACHAEKPLVVNVRVSVQPFSSNRVRGVNQTANVFLAGNCFEVLNTIPCDEVDAFLLRRNIENSLLKRFRIPS